MMKGVTDKKRGSVVLYDWYRADPPDFADHIEPVGHWFGRFGPEEGRTHVRGLGLRLPDGRWKLYKSRAAAKRDYKALLARSDTRFTWAEEIEQLVRKKLKATKPSYVKAKLVNDSVQSSYLYPVLGRYKSDPFIVYVFTEEGIGDPFHYAYVYEWFTKAAEAIREDPWYDDAGWESLRAGVRILLGDAEDDLMTRKELQSSRELTQAP